jgi:hypothetical protein
MKGLIIMITMKGNNKKTMKGLIIMITIRGLITMITMKHLLLIHLLIQLMIQPKIFHEMVATL